MYQAGRFFEDFDRWFFVFDTAAQTEEEQRQPCFLETACLIRDMAAELPRNQRDRYAQRIAACTLWDFDRSKSRYRSTEELRIALKRRIPSLGIAARASGIEKARLSNLISGKVAEVKGDTLRKLIHGLAIQPDCRNDPAPLIAEWVKSETHGKAERFLARLVAFHPRRRVWELLVLYVGTPARSSRLPGLCRGTRLAIFLNRCQQLKRFVRPKCPVSRLTRVTLLERLPNRFDVYASPPPYSNWTSTLQVGVNVR
jgi:DNA-binding Xre family transcriptional regulator